jgi:hypothetical protein
MPLSTESPIKSYDLKFSDLRTPRSKKADKPSLAIFDKNDDKKAEIHQEAIGSPKPAKPTEKSRAIEISNISPKEALQKEGKKSVLTVPNDQKSGPQNVDMDGTSSAIPKTVDGTSDIDAGDFEEVSDHLPCEGEGSIRRRSLGILRSFKAGKEESRTEPDGTSGGEKDLNAKKDPESIMTRSIRRARRLGRTIFEIGINEDDIIPPSNDGTTSNDENCQQYQSSELAKQQSLETVSSMGVESIGSADHQARNTIHAESHLTAMQKKAEESYLESNIVSKDSHAEAAVPRTIAVRAFLQSNNSLTESTNTGVSCEEHPKISETPRIDTMVNKSATSSHNESLPLPVVSPRGNAIRFKALKARVRVRKEARSTI